MSITVFLKGHPVEVDIVNYVPAVKGYYSGLPEDCYPSQPAEIEFEVNTGNELLDALIEENEEYMLDIENQLLERVDGSMKGEENE